MRNIPRNVIQSLSPYHSLYHYSYDNHRHLYQIVLIDISFLPLTSPAYSLSEDHCHFQLTLVRPPPYPLFFYSFYPPFPLFLLLSLPSCLSSSLPPFPLPPLLFLPSPTFPPFPLLWPVTYLNICIPSSRLSIDFLIQIFFQIIPIYCFFFSSSIFAFSFAFTLLEPFLLRVLKMKQKMKQTHQRNDKNC